MRVNVYAEEMTDKVEIIAKEINGRLFTGLRFYLELPVTHGQMQISGPFMHGEDDNDSSAVTFWGKRDLRAVLRKALAMLDAHYGDAGENAVIDALGSLRQHIVFDPEGDLSWEEFDAMLAAVDSIIDQAKGAS